MHVQAGARKVYAIEASNMAKFAQKLFEANGEVGSRIQLMHGKVEALLDTLPEKADILISEPMGTLLVNERMLETYILARKHFLNPGGLMFPSIGRIFVAAFSDAILHAELQSMASFWLNSSFYGVNLTCLHGDAVEVCSQPPLQMVAWSPGLLGFYWLVSSSTPVVSTQNCVPGRCSHGLSCAVPIALKSSL